MAADLPKEFDVIVLGSGMPESIVAAAFSRIGKSVLHLDRNTYYSGDWASFNLQGIEKWAEEEMRKDLTEKDRGNQNRPEIDVDKVLEEGEMLVELPLKSQHFTNVQLQFHVPKQAEDEAENKAEINQDAHVEKCVKEQTRTDIYESKTDDISKNIAKSTHSIHTESGDNDKVIAKDVTNLDSDIGDSDGNSKGGGDRNSRDDTYSFENLAALKINEQSNAEKGVSETINENESRLDDEVSETIHNVDQHANRLNKNNETVLEQSGEVSTNTCGIDKTDQKEELREATKDTGIAGAVLEETGPKIWTEKALRDEWRRFNLDLSPKVLYCGGEMVELLISSDIAKYCEFKTVTRVLTVIDGKVDKVPCSRADVFSSKKVSMLEKRMLMKFLQFCLQYESSLEEIKEFLNKPFTEFLSSRKLTAQIKHFVQHSIAMATDNTTTKQGLERTQKFLQSIGRYGNTAFLWSLYGSGELPQSFCRMCAVFGGTYCLNMSASSVILDSENKCKGIVTTEGQRIACKWLIMESSYANPESFQAKGNERFISRAILIADKPILPSDSQELSMMCLPCPDDGDRPTFVLELPPAAMACPPDLYVFHLTRQSRDGIPPKSDLAYALDTLFQEESNTDEYSEKPKILWSVYFTQLDNSSVNVSDRLPENVFIMSGPGIEVDIDRPVQEARELFKKILPEEEFLPKAPNPEDIIYVDDTEAKVSEDSSQSEFGTQDSDQSQPSKDNSQSEVGTLDSEQSQPSKDNTQSEAETHNSDQSHLSKDNTLLESGAQNPNQSQSSKGCIHSGSAEQESNQSQLEETIKSD